MFMLRKNVQAMSCPSHGIVALRRYRKGFCVLLLVGSLLDRLFHLFFFVLQLLHLFLQFFLRRRRRALTRRIKSYAFVVTRTDGPCLRRGNCNHASTARQPTVEGRGENSSGWMLECACRTSTRCAKATWLGILRLARRMRKSASWSRATEAKAARHRACGAGRPWWCCCRGRWG